MHDCTLPTHPRTGLVAIGWCRRGPIWPITGGAEDDSQSQNDGDQGDSSSSDGAWTPPKSQEEFDAIFARRLERERAKLAKQYENYDDIKIKADQHDALMQELESDHDKALREARETARREALSEVTPRLVATAFRAEAKGVLTAEQTDGLLEDLDLSKYVNDKGEVDAERIAAKIAKLSPQKHARAGVDLGQGQRQSAAGRRPGEAGLAEAAKRFGSKQQ